MHTLTQTSSPHTLSIQDLFSIELHFFDTYTEIVMDISNSYTHTADLPYTRALLQKNQPAVLRSKCFNEENLTFRKEVQNTETGHLFEHILLEYLCQEKMRTGAPSAVFSGRTNWNWKKEKQGMYHIIIDTGFESFHLFPAALSNTIDLFKLILQEGNAMKETIPAQIQEYAFKEDTVEIPLPA